MATIKIVSRWNSEKVLFECEVPGDVESGLAVRHALEKAVETHAYLSGAYLRDANLSGANLSDAYLSDANLSGANLSDANLSGAYLRDAYLRGANLSGAYLRDAYLSGAYLRDAYLSDANLSGAYLSGAYLSGAYLSGANLSGANLSGAYLSGAYMSDANLSGAYLSGANLSDANLSGAYMSGEVKLTGNRPILMVGPIGSRADYLQAFITEAGLCIRAGCFFGTRDEFSARVEAEHGQSMHGDEYRAALVLIDAHSRLWTPAETAAQKPVAEVA